MMRTTPVERTKAAMGYQSAMQRPCCRNCYHGKQVQPSGAYNDVHPWRCTLGVFGTTAQAACDQHQPYQKGGAA